MKRTLRSILVFLLTISTSVVWSQDFVVETNAVIQDFSVDLSDANLLLEMYVDLTNNSQDTLKLKWFRKEISRPDNWQTQVCDNNACYTPAVYSNYDEDLELFREMILPPDSTYEMIFYISPNGQAGTGMYQLEWSFIDNVDSIVSVIDFTANVVSSTTSTYDFEELESIFIYPNPVNYQFRISNDVYVDQVEIRNMLGRRVKLFKGYSGASYDVLDLPQGVYLVRLIDRDNDIIKTIRMSKYSLRP